MSFTATGGNGMMTASMRLGSGKAYVEFQHSSKEFLVTAHVPGRDGGPDQSIQFALNDGQRGLLADLLGMGHD